MISEMSKKQQQAALNHTLAGMNALTTPMDSDGDADRAEALLNMSIALIDSAIDIITNHIRSDPQLTQKSVLMPGGSLGKHFRHVIETYQAFLLPLLPSSPSQSSKSSNLLTINYDAILPYTRGPLARSLPACRDAVKNIKSDLAEWGSRARAFSPGGYNSEGGASGDNGVHGIQGELRKRVLLVAITPTKQEMWSTIGRELWFCSLHAIHHFSMIRTIAVHELGLNLPVEFGTAPSTLLYREQKRSPQGKQLIKSKL